MARRPTIAVLGGGQLGWMLGLAAHDTAAQTVGLPAVMKTRRGGYDGKGQAVLLVPDDLDAAWALLGGVPLLLEERVAFGRELSVVAARGSDGTVACWPVVENEH